jgi:malonyl-CoA O-methyltransferase
MTTVSAVTAQPLPSSPEPCRSISHGAQTINDGQLVDKKQVAEGFNRAARVYSELATIQQQIAEYGLAKLSASCHGSVDTLLDIGCATATSFEQLGKLSEHVIGVDISIDMLRTAMLEHKQDAENLLQKSTFNSINGDAEALPLQTSSVDIVYSSMAMQWCNSPKHVLDEAFRVLKPGGRALLCILTGDSFADLQTAWKNMALPSRVNTFHSQQTWLNACDELKEINGRHCHKSLSMQITSESKQFSIDYKNVVDMLKSIKQIGANTRIADLSVTNKYMSKRELAGLTHHFDEIYGAKNKLPLCYSLLFLEIIK